MASTIAWPRIAGTPELPGGTADLLPARPTIITLDLGRGMTGAVPKSLAEGSLVVSPEASGVVSQRQGPSVAEQEEILPSAPPDIAREGDQVKEAAIELDWLPVQPTIDVAALEAGIASILVRIKDQGRRLVAPGGDVGLTPWLLVGAAAAVACELSRRQLQCSANVPAAVILLRGGSPLPRPE